jgi:transcriptional regulator with XRE-family HTH domain
VTPFGTEMRRIRKERSLTLQQQADCLSVSPAYLSALEHGKKGRPSAALIDQICVWLNLIWDDAEALKRKAFMSHPRPVIPVAGLHKNAVLLANLLSHNIDRLTPIQSQALLNQLRDALGQSDDD